MMTQSDRHPPATNPTRDRIARGLLILSALGALASLGSAVPVALDADDATAILAWHDLFGFPVYAGLFALLAWRPRDYPGVWELLIAQKAIIALVAAGLARGTADDAALPAWADGTLTFVLLIAYVLVRGDLAWRPAGARLTPAEE